VRGEPDASSFPSGGMRSTFEARGYTAWDPTSPPWLLVNNNSVTLVIPTAFVSWTGVALDKKTPLLRSMEALSAQAVRVLKLFGSKATRVTATCGPEQEYFLIDSNFYFARPTCSTPAARCSAPRRRRPGARRSVLRIDSRARARVHGGSRGRALQVRRADQDAPQRSGAVAVRSRADLRERQRRHRSSDDDDGDDEARGAEVRSGVPDSREAVRRRQRLGQAPELEHRRRTSATTCSSPGDTPHDNMQFLFFCTAVIRAVDVWQGLLRYSIAHAGNDHRLGANEAPPAILSVFLGDMLTDIFEQVEKAGEAKSTKSGGVLDIGVGALPKLPRDAGDRNRTSPFAFTGNKFEFRAVGSTQNVGLPGTCLNVAVCESLDVLGTSSRPPQEGREARRRRQGDPQGDHQEAQADHLQRQRLLAEWQKEAGKRGLLNLKNTVDALPQIVTPEGDQGLRESTRS
jgi:glutamine synthetase